MSEGIVRKRRCGGLQWSAAGKRAVPTRLSADRACACRLHVTVPLRIQPVGGMAHKQPQAKGCDHNVPYFGAEPKLTPRPVSPIIQPIKKYKTTLALFRINSP